VLFADTFNNHFEPDILRDAQRVLAAAGYEVVVVQGADRPLCCGRTYLGTGMVDRAKAEARRTLDALLPWARAGVAVVGLEPSCLFSFRDEYLALGLGKEAEELSKAALLFEEFVVREHAAGRFERPFKPLAGAQALLHTHCHQKAFGAAPAVQQALALVPELTVQHVESSCCGMAGSFGVEVEHVEVSRAMGELALLPAVRAANASTLIVADGTSCRHQIHDGAQRSVLHVAQVMARALA
jgi:Fe-S oxidoreductase